MRKVYKYVLPVDTDCKVDMPVGAEILNIGVQNGDLCAWVLVEVDMPYETRRFSVFGTGHEIPSLNDGYRQYLATVLMMHGSLVLHVFENKRSLSQLMKDAIKVGNGVI